MKKSDPKQHMRFTMLNVKQHLKCLEVLQWIFNNLVVKVNLNNYTHTCCSWPILVWNLLKTLWYHTQLCCSNENQTCSAVFMAKAVLTFSTRALLHMWLCLIVSLLRWLGENGFKGIRSIVPDRGKLQMKSNESYIYSEHNLLYTSS